MHIRSGTGNATTTEPRNGFEDPKLTHIFSARVSLSETTPILHNKTVPATVSPGNGRSQIRPTVGAIAGGIVGGFLLVLLILSLFLLRRRQRRKAPPQPLEMPAPAPLEPQELPVSTVYEVHDPRIVFELASVPIELDDSALEKLKK